MTEIIPLTQSSQNSVKDSMNELDELMASLSNSFLSPLASTQTQSATQKQPPSTTNNEQKHQQPPNNSCITASTASSEHLPSNNSQASSRNSKCSLDTENLAAQLENISLSKKILNEETAPKKPPRKPKNEKKKAEESTTNEENPEIFENSAQNCDLKSDLKAEGQQNDGLSIISDYDEIFKTGNAPSNPIDRKSNVMEVNDAFDSLNELIAELDVHSPANSQTIPNPSKKLENLQNPENLQNTENLKNPENPQNLPFQNPPFQDQNSIPDSEKEKQITDLLQELTSSLAEDGILVKSRGTCKACDQEIMGEIVHALGNCYHPEHFFCAVCQCEIGAGTFIARNEKPYCETCYQSYFSPSCPECLKPVLNFCTEAMGKKWHPECFVCKNCEKCLGDEVFVENKGKPYCENCYNEQFAPSCKVCTQPIVERFIFALNAHYHQNCFTCTTCKLPFPKSRFFEYKGDAYCDEHYQVARGFVCTACSEALDRSNYVEALGKKYHVAHFMCAYCFKRLNQDSFKSKETRHYHHECYRRLFDDYA